VVSAVSSEGAVADGAAAANRQSIVAPLVGLFHPWLKPRGGTLVAIGDSVKAGQLVGTIESLNVLNEVEAAVAGRIVEIHAQDGQPVEYGQVLVTIEVVEVEEA
jgi:acetyl-CoA carboxylase biotin carboxyl carrier protein